MPPEHAQHSWEHGFQTRIGVRIWVGHTQTGLSTEPPSYWAFDEKLELNQETETKGVPPPPLTGDKELLGAWTNGCPFSYRMSPNNINDGPDPGAMACQVIIKTSKVKLKYPPTNRQAMVASVGDKSLER